MAYDQILHQTNLGQITTEFTKVSQTLQDSRSGGLEKHKFYINCNKISFNKRTYHVFIL